MSPESIIQLFRLCVEKTYFMFNRKLYLQVNGLAMGASTSGFVADIYIYRLEKKALDTFVDPPDLWKRYVHDTFAKIKKTRVDSFMEHLNKQHDRIEFTTENMKEMKISFLDTEVRLKEDKKIEISIYRKSTHTDQYLNFNSNHHISQKIGIVGTLRHRINTIITTEDEKKKEELRMKKMLRINDYPEWTLKEKKKKEKVEKEEYIKTVSIPYIQKTSEKIAKEFKRYNIKTIYKPSRTMKNYLCKMKDEVDDLDRGGIVYHVECEEHKESYIGECERAMKNRGYEHKIINHKDSERSHSLKTMEEGEEIDIHLTNRKSQRLATKEKINYKNINDGKNIILNPGQTEVSEHMAMYEHNNKVTIKAIAKEDNWYKRGMIEAFEIVKKKPTLNKDNGRYHVPAIYTNLLQRSEASERNDRPVTSSAVTNDTEEVGPMMA